MLLGAALLTGAADYPLGHDSLPQPGVPKGTVSKFVLAAGKYYPGTPHNYSVYVPAKYDASKPAPFMIFMDGSGLLGNGGRVPVVFDNLIAKGDLPPLVGIFVDPGMLPALSDLAQNRYERVFEYDSLTDRYAKFLIEELIPEVAKKYNLSKDPNDRGLAGVSTGAVAAFVAAWNRPDQFRRVLTFIGTFVDMKGADAFPAIIRKTETKPLRVFLQEGRADHVVPNQPYGTFYAGSWPINNQLMLEALEFAGYDVKLELGDEGHNMKQGTAIMPEALRWLWRGYPKAIEVHEPAALGKADWDPRGKVSSIVWADKQWEQVGGSYASVTGTAADQSGNVFFADSAANRIYKVDTDGKVTVFKEGTSGATVLRIGAGGRLYASQAGRKKIVAYDATGNETTVAENVEAADLAPTANGGVYFTDTARKSVGYIDAKGGKYTVYDGGEIVSPMGLALSPDGAMLVVTDAQAKFSWSFQIGADASLMNGEPYFRLSQPDAAWKSGVASVAVDSNGLVYFANPIGIQVCEQNGRVASVLNNPRVGAIASIGFGGKDLSWLYVAADNKLFRRATKVTGVGVWAPVKPPKPPL